MTTNKLSRINSMADIQPFRGYRPRADRVAQVASRPYDVINSAEARAEAEGNPHSFLHVVKPEIDLPDHLDPYDPAVYAQARTNFERLVHQGDFLQDEYPCLYLYRLTWQERSQTGLVAGAAVQDYFDGVIKIHELTRPDKEEDRKNHIRVSGILAEPVFFSYPPVPEIDDLLQQVEARPATYDFVADDGIGHTFWVIDQPTEIEALVQLFAEKVPTTYVADGHHRTACAAKVGREGANRTDASDPERPYHHFMAVHFPADQLRIIDYNRLVRNLNGRDASAFLDALKNSFQVTPHVRQYTPQARHHFSLYLDGSWYQLIAQPHTYDDQDPIRSLDVTILTEQVLQPLLGIEDLRRDNRIDFVGGMRGLSELERRVDNGEMAAAFALYPVSMDQLMAVADSGAIMPPKTTWFEPKLRSGLVVQAWRDF